MINKMDIDVEEFKKLCVVNLDNLDDETMRNIAYYQQFDATRYGIKWFRYIASWYKAGGEIIYYPKYPDPDRGHPERTLFGKWLKENLHLSDIEIHNIFKCATNGKFELENDARKFIEEHKKP